jgi:transcriptional regulator with XRE-family HTH domain
MNSFGNRVDLLRKEHNLNQTELAKIFGVTKSAVSDWKCRGKQPSQETLIGLANFFDVSLEYLLGISDVRKSDPVIVEEETRSFAIKLIEELLKSNTIKNAEDITPALINTIITSLRMDIEDKKKE